MSTKSTIIAITALMTAACVQVQNPMEECTPVSLAYTTIQATETKAAQDLNEGAFASGESVKVRISNTGAGEWTDYIFTTAAEGAMNAPDPAPYYPAGSQNIDIVAYYPSTAGTSFSVQADQTSDAYYKASDLMFASVSNQAKQSEAVNLAFSHKLAKLSVNVTAGTGVGSITGVRVLNVKPTISFDQATGAVGSASGDATSIAMSNNGAAVIPAQTIAGGLLEIVTDQGTATYTVSGGKTFESGKQYTLNITLKLRNVGITNVIAGWASEGTLYVDTVNPYIAGHEYVEMGDGLKWATMNVGASNPEESGDYFAWGMPEPYYSSLNPLTWKDGKNNGYIMEYYFDPGCTKYVMNKKTQLELEDDTARVNWGETWRMPTVAEWTALRNTTNFDWEWDDARKGHKVTSKVEGYVGNSIFIPAAGYFFGDELIRVGSEGYYWSSSLSTEYSNSARILGFKSSIQSYRPYIDDSYRNIGHTVRAVSE